MPFTDMLKPIQDQITELKSEVDHNKQATINSFNTVTAATVEALETLEAKHNKQKYVNWFFIVWPILVLAIFKYMG